MSAFGTGPDNTTDDFMPYLVESTASAFEGAGLACSPAESRDILNAEACLAMGMNSTRAHTLTVQDLVDLVGGSGRAASQAHVESLQLLNGSRAAPVAQPAAGAGGAGAGAEGSGEEDAAEEEPDGLQSETLFRLIGEPDTPAPASVTAFSRRNVTFVKYLGEAAHGGASAPAFPAFDATAFVEATQRGKVQADEDAARKAEDASIGDRASRMSAELCTTLRKAAWDTRAGGVPQPTLPEDEASLSFLRVAATMLGLQSDGTQYLPDCRVRSFRLTPTGPGSGVARGKTDDAHVLPSFIAWATAFHAIGLATELTAVSRAEMLVPDDGQARMLADSAKGAFQALCRHAQRASRTLAQDVLPGVLEFAQNQASQDFAETRDLDAAWQAGADAITQCLTQRAAAAAIAPQPSAAASSSTAAAPAPTTKTKVPKGQPKGQPKGDGPKRTLSLDGQVYESKRKAAAADKAWQRGQRAPAPVAPAAANSMQVLAQAAAAAPPAGAAPAAAAAAAQAPAAGQQQICWDHRNGRCTRAVCRFAHV